MLKIFAASVLLVLAAGSISAEAQTRGNGGKFCLQEKGRGTQGNAADCSYRTLGQCKEAASGNVGTCMKNPRYR